MIKKVIWIFLTLVCFNSIAQSVRIRKDWLELTSTERTQYVNAVTSLDIAFITEMYSEHQRLFDRGIHTNQVRNENYTQPSDVKEGDMDFLPWHRLFLYEMENRLRATGASNLSLPYWNWYNTWDENSMLFGDGAGDNSGLLGEISNYFANWNYQRGFANQTQPVDFYSNESQFSYFAWKLELWDWYDPNNFVSGHATGHGFVGGDMSSPESPRDPIFYIHHNMVDREWSRWVKANPSATHYVLDNNMETFEQWDNGDGSNVNAENYTSFNEFNVWYASDHLLEVNGWSPAPANPLGIGGVYNFNYTTGNIEVSDMFVLPDAEVNFTVSPGYEVWLLPGLTVFEGGNLSAKVK